MNSVPDGYVPAALGPAYGLPTVASPHPMADGPTSLPTPPPAPRRRVRGLQLRALPSAPLLAQIAGGGAAIYGVWLQWGTPLALVVGGVAAVMLGALREAGKV